jgi:hypothetical protein
LVWPTCWLASLCAASIAATGPSMTLFIAPRRLLLNQFNLRLTHSPVTARAGAVGFVVPSTHSYQAFSSLVSK